MHAAVNDPVNRTLPLRGLQYMGSPSLPGPVQKYLNTTLLASAEPSFGGTAGSNLYGAASANNTQMLPSGVGTAVGPGSRYGTTVLPYLNPASRVRRVEEVAAVATHSTLSDPSFSDTLSRLGPSARRLLLRDATTGGTEGERSTGGGMNGDASFNRTTGSMFVKTVPSKQSKHRGAKSARRDSAMRSTHNASSFGGANSHLNTTNLSSAPRSVSQRAHQTLSRRDVLEVPSLGSTLQRNARVEPPLVHTLRSYLEREVRLCAEGSPIPSAADQLLPYREALRAMISAFPGYASILSDIQSAYDNVIQCQAELLTEAYTDDAVRHVVAEQTREDMRLLRHHATALQRDLETMCAELEKRKAEKDNGNGADANGAHQQTGGTASSTLRSDIYEVRRQLERAQQRVAEMEELSKEDVRKILVLIGAVRECDKRIKDFEDTVRRMSGQVEELDEFKRLAGEAQAELLKYKQHFQAVVPYDDFVLMKEYLTNELAAAQVLARRLRRTAAVRGTQVDVISRKLKQLEANQQDNITEIESGNPYNYDDESEDGKLRAPLTPRPSWRKYFYELPELAEHSKNVHVAPLPVVPSAAATAAVASGAVVPTGGARPLPSSVDDGLDQVEVLVVDGPKETALLVEYLVQRTRQLIQSVESAESDCETAQQALRQQMAITTPAIGQDPLNAGAQSSVQGNGNASNSHSGGRYSSQQQQNVAPSSSRGGTYRGGRSRGGAPDKSTDFSQHFAQASQVLRTMALPLIGPGVADTVPIHLRASGMVHRYTLPRATCVRLLFDFFTEVLTPILDTDDVIPEGEEGAPCVQQLLAVYLDDAVRERHEVGSHFRCGAHVALNLLEDAQDAMLTNPALTLLIGILNKRMPARLAVDAVSVITHCIADLEALAKEQQKTRLRRQVISECLSPILELKSAKEIEQLRSTFTNDPTFDVHALTQVDSRFMSTFFFQECFSNMELYTRIIAAVTEKSAPLVENEEVSLNTVENGDRLVHLPAVAEVIAACEPLTPAVVLREMCENAICATGIVSESPEEAAAAQQAHVRLSEVIKAINVAPLIRRTALSNREACAL